MAVVKKHWKSLNVLVVALVIGLCWGVMALRPHAGVVQAAAAAPANPVAAKPVPSPQELDYGDTAPIKGNANANVASAVAAVRSKSHPERLSALSAPAAFDPAGYKANPHAHLDVVEPGRVFQSKQPGKGVLRIRAASPRFQHVEQGKSVTLAVSAVAGMPVTFTSFDLGRFDNQLTSMTVEADARGVAQVNFFGVAGTIADVNILAASPVAAGRVKFIVNVTLPQVGTAPTGP